jgi:prophage regulatory protein
MQLISILTVSNQTGISRRSIYNLLSKNQIPKPVQLTSRRVGWVQSEIDAWIEEKIGERDSSIKAA